MEVSFLIRQLIGVVVSLVSTLVLVSVLRLPSEFAPVVQGLAIWVASCLVMRTVEAREKDVQRLKQENLDNWVSWHDRNRGLAQDTQALRHRVSALQSRLEEASKAAEAVPGLKAKLASEDCRLRQVQGERDEFRREALALKSSLKDSQEKLKESERTNQWLKSCNQMLKATCETLNPTPPQQAPPRLSPIASKAKPQPFWQNASAKVVPLLEEFPAPDVTLGLKDVEEVVREGSSLELPRHKPRVSQGGSRRRGKRETPLLKRVLCRVHNAHIRQLQQCQGSSSLKGSSFRVLRGRRQ